MSAAIATIGARVGATAAASAPTARRLYKYARKGQHIVQVGEVIGIGGGALLGKKAAGAQQGEAATSETKQSSTFGLDENARVKEAKRVLKGLLEGSVVSSAGWYMKGERTIRIKGGPRATMMDGLLVIETDTLEAFEVVSDDPVDEDGKAAFGDGTGEGSLKSWMSSLKKKSTGKDKSNTSDSQTSFPILQVNGEGVKEEETAYQRHQRQLYEKMSESSQWLYSRMRKAPHEPEPVEEASEDAASEKALGIPPRGGMTSPAPPPDDDPVHPPTLEVILQEMGFSEKQILRAKAEVGELPTSKEQEAERKEKVEKAMFMLFGEESQNAKEAAGPDSTVAAQGGKAPATKLDPTQPLPEVVGAEKVTTPHWTTKAKQAVEGSPALKALQVGGSHLFDRGEKWLQKDGKK